MKKLYKFLRLFWTPKCRHKWILNRRYGVSGGVIPWIEPEENNAYPGLCISLYEVCQCSKCGEWKSFKV